MLSTGVRQAPLCTSSNVAVGRGSHIAMSPSTVYLMFHEHLFCGADWKCGFCSRCVWRQCWNIRIQDYNITETRKSPCLGSQNVVKTSGALQLTRKWYSTTARSLSVVIYFIALYIAIIKTQHFNNGHILWTSYIYYTNFMPILKQHFLLSHWATGLKVAGSIPNGVIGILHWLNASGRTMALGSTQPLKNEY